MHMYISNFYSPFPNYLINSLTYQANVYVPSYNANNSCRMVYAALRQFEAVFADPWHSINWFAVRRHSQLSFAVPWYFNAGFKLHNLSGDFHGECDN